MSRFLVVCLLLILPALSACEPTPGTRKAYLRSATLYGQGVREYEKKNFSKAAGLLEAAAKLARPEDAGNRWYNAACAYALSRRLDKAFVALEKSISAGFVDLDNLDHDEDLAALRTNGVPPLRAKMQERFNSAFPNANQELRQKLLEMERYYHGTFGRARPNAVSPEKLRQMAPFADANTSALWKIVQEHGWPGRQLVGDDGASAAIHILHDALDVTIKMQLQPVVVAAAEKGDAPRSEVANFVDTLMADRGFQQTYGTVWSKVHGKIVPHPIDHPDDVDARRAAIGLPPLDEYYATYEALFAE